MGPEVLAMGRVAVDFYPAEIGVRLEDVPTFCKMLGGGAANVAVAIARLGHSTGLISKVGDDSFGVYVRRTLEDFGVDSARIGVHPALRTPVVFCQVFPPDDFLTLFYRQPTAPDMTLTVDEVVLDDVVSVPLLWTTGTGLSAEPSRTATLAALRARACRRFTVHDLDYRSEFWVSEEDAGRLGRTAAALATVVVGAEREAALLVGKRPPSDLAHALLDLGPELAVIKLGDRGALAATAEETVVVSPIEVDVVDGLGAGDAFGAALCHGLLSRWSLERTIRFANASGALVASRLGCAEVMPTEGEVEAVLSTPRRSRVALAQHSSKRPN
jgi:5-dehydro-2-deoxygluconokinase